MSDSSYSDIESSIDDSYDNSFSETTEIESSPIEDTLMESSATSDYGTSAGVAVVGVGAATIAVTAGVLHSKKKKKNK